MGFRPLLSLLAVGALSVILSAGMEGRPLGVATTVRLYDGGLSRESSLEWRIAPRAGALLCLDSYSSPGWGDDWRIGAVLLCRPITRRFTLEVGAGAGINAAPGLAGQLSLDALIRARYGILFAEGTGLFFRDGLFCPSLAGVRVRVWRGLRLHLGGGGYYVTDYHAAGFTPTAAAGVSYGF